jgi:hypothetical protein
MVHSPDSSESDQKSLKSITDYVGRTGFEVSTSAKFGLLNIILDHQNPGSGTAPILDKDVCILMLFIYTYGSSVPNKFFSHRDSPQNTIDLVDDILLKVLIMLRFG